MSSDAHRVIVERMAPAARRVLNLLLRGRSEKEAATQLSMSRHTVHGHVKDIYRQLRVHSRAELLVTLLAPPHVPAPFEVNGVDAGAGASSIDRVDHTGESSDGQATATTPRPHAR